MKRVIIHRVERPFKIEDDIRTACGITASVVSAGVGAMQMIDEKGSQYYGTTHAEIVTCLKCKNLATIGTIHERQSRTADSSKRPVGRPRDHVKDRDARDRDKRAARRSPVVGAGDAG